MSTPAQGADGAGPKTAGQIAYEAAIADLRYAPQWSDLTEDDRRSWGRAAAAILTAACKPWENYIGEPPDDGGPLISVFVAGMVYTERLLAKLLSVRNYESGDGSEDFDRDATQTLRNILTGAGLWDADENRPAALATPRTDSAERTADEGACALWAAYEMARHSPADPSDLWKNTSDEHKRWWRQVYAKACAITPAPSSPGVPDSVRALSEAATRGRWEAGDGRANGSFNYVYSDDATGSAIATFALSHVYRVEKTTRANAQFAAAAVNYVRTLLSAHPAGQSGKLRKRPGDDHDLDALKNDLIVEPADSENWRAATGIHPAGQSTGQGVEGNAPLSTLNAMVARKLERYRANKPAPDSPLTGPVGVEDAEPWKTLALIRDFAKSSILVRNDALDVVCSVATRALAARPAAPEAQGAWQDIGTVPVGVEVIVRGGKTVFGDGPRGSSITVVDDREDLYRPDGSLRPSSPTMWHPAPAPPSSDQGGR